MGMVQKDRQGGPPGESRYAKKIRLRREAEAKASVSAESSPEPNLGKPERLFGTVKWFHHDKNFGFIVPDGMTEEVFVHGDHVRTNNFLKLDGGQRITFVIGKTDRGFRAFDVRIV